MSNQQQLLTGEQKALVDDFVATYGFDRSDIIFFDDDPKPFFGYEATCVLCNKLTDLRNIDVEPVETSFVDALWIKTTVIDSEGRRWSAVGVANINETIDGKPMGSQQLYTTASARSIRNTLRAAGFDLLQLHYTKKHGLPGDAVAPRNNYAALIARAHVLGKEIGLITEHSKAPWHAYLNKRYGVPHSNELSEAQLADFVAILETLRGPENRKLAA